LLGVDRSVIERVDVEEGGDVLVSPSRFSRNYRQPGRRGQTIRTAPVSGCP
jgi:hypothetical protein